MNFGKGIIIIVNKWDLIEKDNSTFNKYLKEIKFKFSYAPYAPILFVSALTGQRLENIYSLINKVKENTLRELKTSDINRVIEESVALSQPPSDTQSGVEPPTFTLFVNTKELFHFSYQRYIMNNLRKVADFEGVRIKLNIKEKGDKA